MSDEEIRKTDDAKNDTVEKNEKAADAKSKTKKVKITDKKKNGKHSGPSKGNPFNRMWAAVVRFFKNTKGEVKKIIWPGRQMVIKSTGVVIAAIIVIGAGVWLIDYALSGGLGLVRKASEKYETSAPTSSASDTTDQSDMSDTVSAGTTDSTAEDSPTTTESTTAD